MNKTDWSKRYIKHLVKRGMTWKYAKENYSAGRPHDTKIKPEDAVDDEMTYD